MLACDWSETKLRRTITALGKSLREAKPRPSLSHVGGIYQAELYDCDDVSTGDNAGGENNLRPTPSMSDDAQQRWRFKNG